MITIRIEFNLSRDDLTSALCWTQRGIDPDDKLPSWSKAEIGRQVREVITYAGREAPHYWRDALADLDEDAYSSVEARIKSWAETCVKRAWPNA